MRDYSLWKNKKSVDFIILCFCAMPLTVLCQLLHLHWVEDILTMLGIFYNLTVIWGHKKEVLYGLKFQPQMCFKSDLSDLLTLPGHGIG